MKFSVKKSLLSVFVLVFLFLFSPVHIFAQTNDVMSKKTVVLDESETVDHDYFKAGERVVIDGTINGDAYIAGGQVDVNGTINGDLLVAGGQVTVRGVITQNIRAVGGNILIEGEVGRNIGMLGGNLTIDKGANISGDAALAGGNIDIFSSVKNLTLASGNVLIASPILGNVMAVVGAVDFASGAKVNGDFTYWSDTKVNIPENVSISGKTSYNQTNFKSKFDRSNDNARKAAYGFNMFVSIVSIISSLIIGLILIKLFRVFSKRTSEICSTKPWKALLAGFVTLVVTPVFVLILMITVVGIPIALISMFAYFVTLYLAKIFVSFALGMFISKVTKTNLSLVLCFVFGLAVYYLLSVIPVFGGIVKFIVLLLGTGAIVLSKREYYLSLREKKLI